MPEIPNDERAGALLGGVQEIPEAEAKVRKDLEELSGAYVELGIRLHDEKHISSELRDGVVKMANAAGVLVGKAEGVKNHIQRLAGKILEASKPKDSGSFNDILWRRPEDLPLIARHVKTGFQIILVMKKKDRSFGIQVFEYKGGIFNPPYKPLELDGIGIVAMFQEPPPEEKKD